MLRVFFGVFIFCLSPLAWPQVIVEEEGSEILKSEYKEIREIELPCYLISRGLSGDIIKMRIMDFVLLNDPEKVSKDCKNFIFNHQLTIACARINSDSPDQIISKYCKEIERSSAERHRQSSHDIYNACMSCPDVVSLMPSQYVRFSGLNSSQLYDVIAAMFHSKGYVISGGNKEFGIISTGWRSIAPKRVGIMEWSVMMAVIADYRFVSNSEDDFYLSVQCYKKLKSPHGSWLREVRVKDGDCVEMEKDLHQRIAVSGGGIK